MKNKKRLATALAAICIISQYGCVIAEDYADNAGTIELDTMTVTGDGISVEDKIIKITLGGDFVVTGEADDAMIHINTDQKVKLRLSGMSLTNSDGPAIFFENCEKAFITVTEDTENYLSDGSEYQYDAKAALFSNDDLEIKGNGVLTVVGNYKHSIASDDDIKIENSTLNVTSLVSDGIHVNNTFEMTGGVINITAESDGIQAEENVLIEDGVINILKSEEGIESGTYTTINAGEINIVSSDDGINTGGGLNDGTAAEGMWGRGEMQMPEGEMSQGEENGMMMPGGGRRPGGMREPNAQMQQGEIPEEMQGQMPWQGEAPPEMPEGEIPEETQNGEMPPQGGRGFGRQMRMNGEMPQNQEQNSETGSTSENAEASTDKTLYINGGIIKINADGDGIDSNGNIVMTGGEVYINGPENSANGAIDCMRFNISGGVIVAADGGMMSMTPTRDSEQGSMMIRLDTAAEAGDVISLKNSDGKEIMSLTLEKTASAIVYSSEELTVGENYTLFVNDEEVKSIEMTENQVSEGRGGFGGFGGGMRGPRENFGQGQNGRNRVRVKLNGSEIQFDTQPIIKDDTTLVPLRNIFEALGMEVVWDEETSTVTAQKDGVSIILQIGSRTAKKNDEIIELACEPVIENSRTLVPVRFIAESLEMNVDWVEETQSVEITE